jgi:hypothetical protein
MHMPRISITVASLAAALACAPAWAALGGTADSVQADAAALKSQVAARSDVRSASYTVQRLSQDNGTVIDEYLSASGTVFAVHWSGARPPDLSQLLGSYYVEYQAAYAQPQAHSNHVRIEGTNLRYSAGGHMRSYWGTAYVPALLPAGLDTEGLK